MTTYFLSYCYQKALDKILWKKTYEREGINYFWSIKNSTEILKKLKQKDFKLQLFLHTIFLRFTSVGEERANLSAFVYL